MLNKSNTQVRQSGEKFSASGRRIKTATKKAIGSEDLVTREHMISVATKLFSESGFDGVSTRDIASKAKVNISLISYYFGGKEGLYKAVIRDFAVKTRAESQHTLEGLDLGKLTKQSFLKLMGKLVPKIVSMKFNSSDIQKLLHREILNGLPYAQEIFEEVLVDVLEKIVSIYIAGQKNGFVKKEIQPYVLFFSMVHAIDQYILMVGHCKTSVQKKVIPLPQKLEEYSDQIFRIYVEGVLV